MDGFAKKATTKAEEAIKQIKKGVGEEVGEVLKHAEGQIVSTSEVHPTEDKKQPEISPIMEALQQASQESLTDEEKEKRQRDFIERMQNAEEELKKERAKDEEKLKAWRENVETAMKIVAPGEAMEKPLEIPGSKPSRGKGKMKGKPGTEPTLETRKSKQ
jgi:hypothetical protein